VEKQTALSTDVSWQLAKDADGPAGKMKNTRKFGFSEYVKSDKKIGNLEHFLKIRNGHKESNHNTILDKGKMRKNTWIIRYIDSNNTIQVGLISWDMRSRPKK
jgi:hypothetical protein